MDVGTEVWVKSETQVWEPGIVLDCQAVGATGVVKVRLEASGAVITSVYAHEDAAENELYIRNKERSVDAMACLTGLEHLHEPALLHALSERFEHDEIYTSIGDILVAVNPLKPLDLYTQATIDRYKDAMYRDGDAAADRTRSSSTSAAVHGTDASASSALAAAEPHVFAIGAKAFGGLLKPTQRNQSILVSGESGSGKTETTKFLMQFLTSVGRDASACALAAGEVVEIGRRILQTNPILESFGNAQTIRNDNSSRFGKFIKIQFGQRNEIVGAEIASYLLEKVRLIHQSPGERNFHIFYELLEGADAAQLTALGLARGAKYELLNAYGGPMNRRAALGANQFAKRFAQTVQAFDDTGVARDEQDLIFRVLAALLHLGNLNFMTEVHEGKGESGTRDEAAAVTTATRHHFDKCAELLGVTPDDLASLLLTRRITAGSEVMVLKQSAEQAKDICRSLAKAIYGRMFSWLVRRLSDGINYISDSAADAYDYDAPEIKTIGILDIFGFESLDRNGFEQLCINYANERLQAQFNEFVFIREQDVYVSEGIDWRSIPYPSNDACLALFDDKANGLFSLLDQECLMPKGSDDALGTKFYRYHGGSADAGAAATAGSGSVTGGSLLKHQQSLPAYTLPQLVTSFGRYLHPSTSEQQVEKEPEPGVSKAKPFSASKMDRVKHQFVVNHFAGKVCYRIEQFVEKNLDMLPADASTVFHASSNALVSAIGDVEVLDQVTTDRAPGRRRPSLLRAPSVSAQFKSQLDRLVEEIGWTEAHYIRCLKPNELKRPGIFDRARMVEQLRSVGVLEALRIARAGYSVRLNHASFIELFASTFRSRVRSRSEPSARKAPRAYCEALVAVLVAEMHRRDGTDDPMQRSATTSLLDTDADGSADAAETAKRRGAQVGRTLVFCKNETFKTFSRLRLERRDAAATVLQRYYRGYRRRRRFQQLRDFVHRIQSIVRGFIARKQVRELRQARRLHAASAIQRCWRNKVAYDRMVERQRRRRRLRAACAIQRCWRSKLARNCATERKIERFRLHMAFRLVQLAVARLREYVSEPEDAGGDDEAAPALEVEAPDVAVPAAEPTDAMMPEIPVTIVPPVFVDVAPPTASADERSDSDEQEATRAKHKASSKASSKSKAKAKLKAKKLKASSSSTGRRDKHRSKHGTASTSDASSLSSSSSSDDDAPRKKKSSSRREKHRGRRVEASESESSSSSSDDERARRRKKSPSSRSAKHRRSHRADESASESSSSSRSSASLSSSDSSRHRKKKTSSRHRRHRSHSRRSTASKSAKKKRKDALADEARNLKLETEILRLKQMLLEKHSSSSSAHGGVRPSKRPAALSSASMARTSRDAARFGIEDLYPDPLDIQARASRRSLSLDEIDFSADEAEDGDEVSGLLPPRRAQSVYHTRQLDHVSMLSQRIEELDAKCKFLEQLVARKSFDESSRSSVAYSHRSSGSGGWDRRRYPSVIDTSSYADSQLSDRDHGSSGEMDGMIRSIQQQMDMLRQTMATKEEALASRHATSVSSSRRTRSSSMASTGSLSALLTSDATATAMATHHHPHHHHHHSYAHNALLSPSESHRKQPSSAGSGYSAGSHGFPPTPTSSLLPGQPHSGGPTRMGSLSSVSGASGGGGGRHVPRIVKWARSNQCFECEEPFNIFVRRHHCRMCGNSFCHEHSSRRVTLSGIGFDDEPVRVCDPCFADHCTYAQGPYTSVAPQYSGFPSYGNGSSLSALASSHTSAA